ncbi:HDOD domain-containing protein [Massilia sp. LXY-6]|uniref:HDOD domain-containing protein n=1 Tax=Massilia sp. LXY-6 TaxID=3379823 RepID=UPI003EE32E0B
MKNWIARLFGGGEGAAPEEHAPAAGAPAAHPAGPDPSKPEPDRDHDFWRWLTAGAAAAAPTAHALPHAQLVLGELDRLVDAPLDAAGLIPRVPEVIPQLLRSLRDESASSVDLARQVARDPALVAELIREANSPFYRSSSQVRTIDAALLVLGRNGLRMLLARAAFRPLIGAQGGRHSRQAAPRIWRHTEQCALAASLLAPALRADPFEAYLAGLMDDLGLIVALRLFDGMLEADALPQDPALVAALFARSRTLAARIALQWELPPPIAAAILGARGQGPSAGQPLAAALGRAERLVLLRLLLDAGMLDAEDPAVAGLDAASARVFERLAPADRIS